MASEAAVTHALRYGSTHLSITQVAELVFDAGAAHGASAKETELHAPSPCGVAGHWMIDWVPVLQDYGPADPGYCLACRQLTKLRDKITEAQKETGDLRYSMAERDIKARTEGFELAHELAKCGHARANYRDPNYKSGDTECDSSKCEFCARERALQEELALVKGRLDTFTRCNIGAAEVVRNARDEIAAWKEACGLETPADLDKLGAGRTVELVSEIAALKESLRWALEFVPATWPAEYSDTLTSAVEQSRMYVENLQASRALLSPAPASEIGDYSCASCGFGMKEPCEHWKKILAASTLDDPETWKGLCDELGAEPAQAGGDVNKPRPPASTPKEGES